MLQKYYHSSSLVSSLVLFRPKVNQRFLTLYAQPVYTGGIYLLKVNDKNTRKRSEICSKLTIKTPERRQWRRSGIFIVNFEHILGGSPSGGRGINEGNETWRTP